MPEARGAAAVTAAITTTMVVATGLHMVVAVLAPLLQRDLGLSATQLGLVTSGVYFVAAVLSPAGGRVVDRAGSLTGIAAIVVCSTVSFVVLGGASTGAAVVVAVVLAGCANALSNPATNAVIAAANPVGRRGWAVGWKQSGVPMATLLVGLSVPPAAALWGWRGAVLRVAVTVVVVGAAAAAVIWRRTSPMAPVGTRPKGPPGRLRLRHLNALGLVMGVLTGTVGTYLVLYLVQVLDFDVRRAGLVSALLGASGIVARVLGPVVAERRFGARTALRLMGPVAVLAIVAFAAAPWAGSWLVWVGGVLGGSITIFTSLGMLALVQAVDGDALGAVTGALSRSFFAGFVVGPMSVGVLLDRIPEGWVWSWGFLVLAAMAATGIARTARFLELSEGTAGRTGAASGG